MAPAAGPGSVSSGGVSSEGGSEASHETLGVLGRDGDADATDLLRGSNTSTKETFFPVLFFIYTNRALPTDWRYVGLAVLLQWVQIMILFFGPTWGWDIDWTGNGWWRFYKRLQLQNVITEHGFGHYQGVLYGGTALILALLAIVLWLYFVLRTKTKFRWQWPTHLLRMVICVVFTTLQTSYVLLFTVALTCGKKSEGYANAYFPSRACFAMPQAALFGLSLFMALLYTVLSALFALIETGATEPLSSNLLSLSAGNHFFMRRLLKFTLPLVPVALRTVPRWEGWVNLLLTTWYMWITLRYVPYHRSYLNIGEAFLYSWCWYASGLALIGIYYPQYWPDLTTAFLAGMAPVGLAFGGLCWWRLHRIWAVAAQFERWTPQMPRREVHRFRDEEEVEIVARVCHEMARGASLDWVPVPRWVDCAGNVLRAGLVQFPDSSYLNIHLGSFEAVLRQEPSGGLSYLQRARKCPSITISERFQCYVREQEKLARKSKEGDSSAIMDGTSWAEYQANYRAVIRAHKGALTALKSFWQLLLHSDVSMVRLQRAFQKIEKGRSNAERCYRTVMERYPNNPRIMRAYSRFLQQVKNDPHGSARYSGSANRIEQRQNEARAELMFGQMIDRSFKDEAATKMMGMIDETSDAVCVINLEGLVQHVNEAFLRMFGFRKGELEGNNVSRIMPNPFSMQHDGYLRNYANSRVPRILDTCREVVALHKHRFVFPISLCVTPVTLGGTECFLGVIAPMDDDDRVATAYCTAAGNVVCVSRGFGNVLGYVAEEVMGRSFASLSSSTEKAADIVNKIVSGPFGQIHEFGTLMVSTRYGEEVQVSCTGSRAGTDAVRVAKIHMSHADRYSALLVVNPVSARIIYANATLSEMLGYTSEQLLKSKLHDLMPEPLAQLHQRYMKGRDLSRCPGLKCRSGRVVEFKAHSGKLVPALMELSERGTDAGPIYSVKVAPVASKEEAEYNRVTLTVDSRGVLAAPPQGNASILSLESTEVAGRPLSDFLDAYRRDGRSVAEVQADLVARTRSKQGASFRVAAAIRGRRTVPCVLVVVPPADKEAGKEEGATTMHLYRADYLEGILELDARCRIKKASGEAALIFGLPAAELVGEPIQKVLPRVCPDGATSELLVARGQKGGSKRSIGAVISAEGVHPDGKPLHVSLQAAASTERPGRYLARVIVPRPISAFAQIEALLGAVGAAAGSAAPAAGGILQPGIYAAAEADEAGHAAGAGPGYNAEAAAAGCPFHRALSGGSSLLQRLGMGSGSRPASGTAAMAAPAMVSPCPINHDTGAVLAGLSFPPDSQFADPAAAAQVAAEIVAASHGAGSRPPTGSRCPAGFGGSGTAVAEDRAQSAPAQQAQEAEDIGPQPEGGGSGGEGGEEEAMDPAELQAKMQRVANWLSGQAAAAEGLAAVGAEAPGTIAAGGAVVHARGRSGAGLPDGPLNSSGKLPLPDVALALEESGAIDKAGSAAGSSTAGDSDGLSSAAGSSGLEDDDAADFSRLKRFKKAYKLLNSRRAREAINTLQRRVLWVLAALVLAHTICFAVSVSMINSSMVYIKQIDMAATAARNTVSALTDVRNIQYAVATMMSKVNDFEAFLEFLFFQRDRSAAATRAYFQDSRVNVTQYEDVGSGDIQSYTAEMSLWEAAQHAVDAFRSVAALPEDYIYNMTENPDWRFLIANIPEIVSVKLIYATDLQARLAVSRLHAIVSATWGLLGGEALFIPLVALYLFWLLRAVAIERFNLFAVFLYVPRPAVLVQARAEVQADDLDDASDDEDETEAIAGGAGTVSMQLSARTLAARAAQDKMAMTRRRLVGMLCPLGLWLVVVAVAFLLQFYWVSTSSERVLGLNASERLFIYNARARFFANELLVEGTALTTDTAKTLDIRAVLDLAATRLRFYSDTLLYGSHNPYRPLDNAHHNLAGMNFPPTLFTNPARFRLLYEQHVCHRADPSTCLPSTNNLHFCADMGLDTYMHYMAEQAHTLAKEDILAISVTHPARQFLATAGNAIFMYVSNFTYTKILQSVVLASVIVGAVAYHLFFAKPYIRATQAESRKVAEVLSYLPGVDVGALMDSAAGRSAGDAAGGGLGLSRSRSFSSNGESS
ncbi:hypothetical protein ABPG75_009050 [Micractinium tetrahymenae]